MIPLIPKLPPQFSFVSNEELESHLVIPFDQPQDIIPIVINPCDILLPTQNMLVPTQEILLPPEESLIPILEISVPPEEVLIPVLEEMLTPAQGILPPPEELILPIPILENRMPLFGSSEDDWVMVTTSEIDDFVTCITVRSNNFVLPEYILLFNSVVVPYVDPLPPGTNWISTPFEDSREIVTLHRVDEMMIIIKIETLIFSSVYRFYCN